MAERNALYGVDEYGRQLGEDAPVAGAVEWTAEHEHELPEPLRHR